MPDWGTVGWHGDENVENPDRTGVKTNVSDGGCLGG
jgi:hypothetical protein